MRAERSIVIDASPSDVFAYLTDVTRHPEWAGNPLQIRPTSAGPLRVGSTWESTGRRMGTHVDRDVVTILEPARRFAHESEGDLGRWRTTYTLERGTRGTTLHREMQSLKLSAFARMLSPMIALFNGAEMGKNLRMIKARVEAEPGQASSERISL